MQKQVNTKLTLAAAVKKVTKQTTIVEERDIQPILTCTAFHVEVNLRYLLPLILYVSKKYLRCILCLIDKGKCVKEKLRHKTNTNHKEEKHSGISEKNSKISLNIPNSSFGSNDLVRNDKNKEKEYSCHPSVKKSGLQSIIAKATARKEKRNNRSVSTENRYQKKTLLLMVPKP